MFPYREHTLIDDLYLYTIILGVGSEKKKGKLNVMYIKLVFEHKKLHTISK